MDQTREIVITGVGVVSPLGIGKAAFWNALEAGRSGVAPLVGRDLGHFPVPFGAEIKDFDPKQYVRPRKSLKVMSREIQIAFTAAAEAMADAGLEKGQIDAERLGVVFGSEMIYSDVDDLAEAFRRCIVDGQFDFRRWGGRAMSDIQPLWMLKYLPNMPACHIGIAHDARGPNNSITMADVSSLLAVAEGARVLERGQADAMIVGGVGSRLSVTGVLWRGDRLLSHRADDPAAASRPFDAGRDGTVNGEGAASFVLETRSSAEARGVEILARALGAGCSFEPRVNGRSGSGTAIARAIRHALCDANMKPSDVGHVNAHGLSTVEEDALEARAIHHVLADVPVTAPKSFFGNLGAGSGAVEMAASVLSFHHGAVPITLNYQTPDPECPVNVIHDRPHRTDRHVAVVVNHTRTGQAAAVVLAGP